MAIEAILFDLGKVIIDFNPSPMLKAMTACASKPAAEFERVLRDADLAHRYETGAMTTDQFHQHLRQFGGLEMSRPDFLAAWSSVFEPELLVSENLLKVLGRRYPLLLVSNTNEAHVTFIAGAYPVFDYFTHKVFSHEIGAMKPDRRIYERAIALSGAKPDALFFVDDREENVLAARELGIHAHQFVSQSALVSALRDRGVELQQEFA